MDQTTFADIMVDRVQQRLIAEISKADLIAPTPYSERPAIPKDLIMDVYRSLDMDAIKASLKARLEAEMADKIADKLMTEFANDIKQVMSNKELREELRSYVRERVRGVADPISK